MATSVQEIALPDEVARFLSSGTKHLLIGGKWQAAASGKTFATHDPATKQPLAEVSEADSEDVDRAVKAARDALEDGPWPHFTAAQRARCLFSLADLIEQNAEELAYLETLDNGKPIQESRYLDIPIAAEVYRYYGGWATKIHGETIPVSPPVGKYLTYTLRQPVGVVGAIVPWNFPMLLTSWKLGPALAAGNTVVLKPAEQTPLTALRLGELIEEAGFPPGVVNIVPGFGPTAGAAIAGHLGIDKVAFTGSTETGRRIVAASIGNLKRISLELGGKSPNIVFADADLDAAVEGAFLGIFLNQGQVCCAGSRLFVEAPIRDEFLARLTDYASTVKLGPGVDEETTMGPLVSEQQFQRVRGYIESGEQEGAKLLIGGNAPDDESLEGWFVQPTIFSEVNDEMLIAKEEIFGPVLASMSFVEEEEALARANATQYGLAAGIWTSDVKRAHRFAEGAKAGTVWINGYNMLDASAPFGGYKMSGYGRELGMHGLQDYTQVKSVWVNLD